MAICRFFSPTFVTQAQLLSKRMHCSATHTAVQLSACMVHMKTVANRHPELFFQVLSKLLPREINTHLQQDTTIDVTVYRSVDEVKNAMLDAGMSSNTITAIQAMLPVPIIEEEKPVDEEAHDDAVDILFDRDRS
jgi:hypothetical protein